MGNFTIGRYLAVNSFIHKLDSRLKLIINLMLIITVFFTDYLISLLIILLPIVLAYIISTKSIIGIFRLMKMPLVVGLILYFVNIYTMKIQTTTIIGDSSTLTLDNIYVENPGFIWLRLYKSTNAEYGLTWPQVSRTIALILRIYIMILTTTILVMTTKPVLLTKAIEDLLLPFKLFFVPTHIIATIISISLRFIPTLLEEAQRISKAQASRGIDLKNGKFFEKAKSLTTLIIPLFVTSFAKAEDLSNAMETRGYDPYSKRTRYRKLVWNWKDYLIFIFIILLISFIIITQLSKYNLQFFDLPFWYTNTKIY
ncbi:energy-coupling factor transporter transmembrane component T [Mycoplasma sp. 744]|uniref:energy-coupling factor transporter transmembrane component T family protein n=1 Tax=Mycoplasma sp. 744 TaxID=3108531 RepID=UPI002B1E0A41|nr:energy-coupling factor transporter transmembrane component T [Mycoplasma sp. 744]MEA4115611.1 energy-coupling factor transporter transmembrane component T [Mycoplasma sp. 744]